MLHELLLASPFQFGVGKTLEQLKWNSVEVKHFYPEFHHK